MDDLIGCLVADAGVDRNAAEMAMSLFSTSWPTKDLPTKYNCSWPNCQEPKL